jgi:general nucleoside transport system permease protein
MKNKPLKLLNNAAQSAGLASFLASVVSICIGLLAGYLLLIYFNAPASLYGFRQIIVTGLGSAAKFAKVLYQTAPLMMTGLAVGFAFKTGLFNIGATGQYTMGAMFALYAGIVLKFPWWAALLAAMVGGAVWGLWPGLFKALFNVNEVITSIMFNWIGLFLVNMLIANTPAMIANFYGAADTDRTANLAAANPSALIPKWGLDKVFQSPYINISILVAILMAIIAYVVLNRTTFGYELKACGLNRNASVYAGINAKRNIILSMVIAGSFAGLGGGIYYLSGTAQFTMEKVLLAMGFNGLPVALLAMSNPVGIIFSALFISYIQVGGEAMQPEFAKEIIDIIIAVIIYLSAIALLMKGLIRRILNWRTEKRAKAALAAGQAGTGEEDAP